MSSEKSKAKILVVDDEVDILELIRYNLDRDGYRVITALTGEEALSKAQNEKPDLVLLDLMLPGMDGMDVCRHLKADSSTSQIQIIMLSAKGEETDIVIGLELGADDYVTKPFSPRILLARVKAVLRRHVEEPEMREGDTLVYRDIMIHPGRHEVYVDKEQVSLTATEFRILQFLIRRPGWVFTRIQIVDTTHEEDYPVTDRTVDVHIASLRKKLGDVGNYIETVRGIGYRIKEIY